MRIEVPKQEPWIGSWKAAWSNGAFRAESVLTVVLLLVVLRLFSRFIEWVELRGGVVLDDPLIGTTAPHDFTWLIFLVIYAGLIVGLVLLVREPTRLMTALQAYIVMVMVRVIAMYVTPLDPPKGIIPLADPFVQFFGSGSVPTKDLFFSGHTATLLLLSFTSRGRWLKLSFAAAACLVAVLIVWQHVHYTVDVVVAPFVAYTSYRIVLMFHKQRPFPGGL